MQYMVLPTQIVNVYQLNYGSEKAKGLGDFLRGSLALFQVSRMLGVGFDIHIQNHPLSEFIVSLDSSSSNPAPAPAPAPIANWVGVHFNEASHLRRLYKDLLLFHSSPYYMISNSFPILEPIPHATRAFLRERMQPTDEMKNYVQQTLARLRLSPKQYTVIHIRTGDAFLVKNQPFPLSMAEKIARFVQNNTHPHKKYLLLSDSNALKRFLKQRLPFLFVYIKPVTHLGEEGIKTRETIKNTLLDFYIMRLSQKICGVTRYAHGSGFCQSSALLFNIPYTIYFTPELFS